MPPSSNKPLIASLSRQPYLGSSPDNDSGSTEPELQPKLSKSARKKQARHAAKVLYDDETTTTTKPSENDVTTIEPPPAPPPAPAVSLLSQIPHAFSKPQKVSPTPPLLDEQFGDVVGEKVSDQSTPPYDEVFPNVSQSRFPVRETVPPSNLAESPPIQPGFGVRGGFSSKSPPISPPQRYARPVSFGGGIPPLPSHPRMVNRPQSRTTSHYGSPPAPHLPQPHFYHAHDVDVPMPGRVAGGEVQDSTLVKQTLIPSRTGDCRPGILLGFDGRLSLLLLENGKTREVGAIAGLPGTVLDALLLPATCNPSTETGDRFVAVVLHVPRVSEEPTGQIENVSHIPTYSAAAMTTTEYVTVVEVYSMASQRHIATILETPPMHVQSYRGVPPEAPPPLGNFRLFSSGRSLVIASGTSGEVFILANTADNPGQYECLAKLWTSVQHQIKRRDSSHGRSSDTDMSPADPNRGLTPTERAIIDLNGRWLAVSPPSLPSRPSLNVRLGPEIVCRKRAGFESITAPTKPSLSCEVDSPDADSMLGKVARGVAQELVKGAKWLGDQGYQTWQNYWKKDLSPPASLQQQSYSPPTYHAQRASIAFPPTHGEALPTSKEPDIVSIYDLQALHEPSNKRKGDDLKPVATFQPPRGCSFISFAPSGLNLLTAGRKGDVQYVWDLMQIHYCRAFIAIAEDDRLLSQPRVRQITRFERLSGSTIVDVVWEAPSGLRFVVLTQNRTIHMFDLPSSASRWPPPRTTRRAKPIATSNDTDNNQGGFLASAMSMASKAQPMVAGWRGRAPSMGGGLAGIGQTSIGLATATGARSSKAVASGLSKSLNAASETVSHLRHAGESRLHLKSYHDPTPDKIAWITRGQQASLSVLDAASIKSYRVRKTKAQDKSHKESTSVFDARKAMATKLPRAVELQSVVSSSRPPSVVEAADHDLNLPGFYTLDETSAVLPQPQSHPLSYAEIETNAPYQPFHSDRRVALNIFEQSSANTVPDTGQKLWIFGDEIPAIPINLARVQIPDDEEGEGSVIYRETTMSGNTGQGGMEHIVSTTRRGRKKKVNTGARQQDDHDDDLIKDDFFEDDCEVLDFATDRV